MDKNKIFRVAKNEYLKWITNPKMIIILVMLIFIYDYVIKEFVSAAGKMGVKLQALEGFIGTSNSRLLLMIIPIVFIGIMGDFPRVDHNAMFYIFRVGKINWFTGQVLFSVMASLTYIAVIAGFNIITVLGKCYFTNNWSDVVTKYYIFAPDDTGGIVNNLITGRLYNNMTPVTAFFNIAGLMTLLLILISIILIMSFVLKNRTLGIGITAGIICIGNVMTYMENKIRWIFPTSHSVMEIHFDEIYRKPIFDIRFSYLYYIALIFIFIMVSIFNLDKLDFSRIQELEE